jgi:hypothetical protein
MQQAKGIKLDPATIRAHKVARFKSERAAKERLATLKMQVTILQRAFCGVDEYWICAWTLQFREAALLRSHFTGSPDQDMRRRRLKGMEEDEGETSSLSDGDMEREIWLEQTKLASLIAADRVVSIQQVLLLHFSHVNKCPFSE